jgi:hypothetical protein
MKVFLAMLIASACSLCAFAKGDGTADKANLINKMVSACKEELAKDPALTETTDGEMVWKNLEDKEHAKVKLSKNCDKAHEKYEHKYHKEESSESEHH